MRTSQTLNEIVGRLQERETTVEEAACEFLEVIEAADAEERFEQLRIDELLGEAKSLDRSVLEGMEPGPLHGVPFAVDVSIDVAGSLADRASRSELSKNVRPEAACVELLRRAGGLLMGRLDLSKASLEQALLPLFIAPDVARGAFFMTPSHGQVSLTGVKLRSVSTQTLQWRASDLSLLRRAAAVLDLAFRRVATERSASGLTIGILDGSDLGGASQRLERAGHRVISRTFPSFSEFGELAALVAKEEDRVSSSTKGEVWPGPCPRILREAYDGLAGLRSSLEKHLDGLDLALLAAGGALEGAWGALHLPVVGVPPEVGLECIAIAPRFEDGRLLKSLEAATLV